MSKSFLLRRPTREEAQKGSTGRKWHPTFNQTHTYWFSTKIHHSVAATNKGHFASVEAGGICNPTEHQNGAAWTWRQSSAVAQQQRFCLSCLTPVEVLFHSKNRSMAGSSSLYDSLLMLLPRDDSLRRYSWTKRPRSLSLSTCQPSLWCQTPVSWPQWKLSTALRT